MANTATATGFSYVKLIILSYNLATFAYNHAYQNLDRGIIELLGPHGISSNIYIYKAPRLMSRAGGISN